MNFNIGGAITAMVLFGAWIMSVIFVFIFKLFNTINLSWFWVSSFVWIPIVVYILFCVISYISPKILYFLLIPFRFISGLIHGFRERF